MTNIRIFQTERVYRQQFQIWQKWQKVIQTGRKHCFQKACFPGASKGVIVWEWVNMVGSKILFIGKALNFKALQR